MMEPLLSVMVAVLGILLVIVFALAWIVSDLSRDVTELARLCGRSCEAQVRQKDSE